MAALNDPQQDLPEEPLERLRAIVRLLRSPDGCPWDREQTHLSLRAGLLEEAAETVDAITRGDDAHFCEELGDLLLQVVFHADLARERGAFDLEEAARGVGDKLIRRHPHVFGKGTARTTGEVLQQWEQIKRAEKGPTASSVLDGIPLSLPALLRAANAQKKAARVGFDWEQTTEVLEKLQEETAELSAELPGGDPARLEDEIGDLLFTVVNLARKLHVDPEVALHAATAKFIRRFRAVEQALQSSDRRPEEAGAAELDRLWRAAKASGL